METKNIFKTLAMAMLLPAMLLTTACSNSDDDDAINNNENIVNNTEQTAKKGYPLQVTVNVTREGDEATTRASYNESTKKLSFSSGDKLFVEGGSSSEGSFAGTLDYVPATGNFSGTIYTSHEWTGTADAHFTAAIEDGGYINATLLPAGYGSYGYLSIYNYHTYDDFVKTNKTYTCATSKADGVAQFSYEKATTYSSGFALAPQNAILNFTITGLAASTNVDVALTGPSSLNITGSVTTNLSGEATFAIGVAGGTDFNDLALTVGGNAITLASGSKTLTAGEIYNVNRAPNGALCGKFSVSSTKKVRFSKGNLNYDGSNWSFHTNQYDRVRTSEGYLMNYPMDLFCWGNVATPALNGTSYVDGANNLSVGGGTDWGANTIYSGSTATTGWRTLTSSEWTWLLGSYDWGATPTPGTNCRTSSTVNGVANARFAKAYLDTNSDGNGDVHGIIIFPDSYTHPDGVAAPTGINAVGNTSWNANKYNATDWGKMQTAGAVFLPAAGSRYEDYVDYVSANRAIGAYWSSTYDESYFEWESDTHKAYNLSFGDGEMSPCDGTDFRGYGFSVRLVKDAN